MTFALGCLFVVFGAAVALGLLVFRLDVNRGHVDKLERRLVGEGVAGALGFIGAAAAFLLGVLMLSSLDHYNETKDTVDAEALAYSAAFDSTAGLAPADQAALHRDLVCLMRSVTTNSWEATQAGDLTGSENTHAWRARVFGHANAVFPSTKVEENSLSALQTELVEASKSGQKRLLSAESGLGTALWIVVYVSIFVLTATLAVLLRPNVVLAVTLLGSVLILSMAMVGTLAVFAEPFTRGDGVFISPKSLNSVMVRLEGTYPGPAWEPCERLAAS